MNADKQRIAIAEGCGFVPSIEAQIPHRPIWTHPKHKDCYWTECDLPDYINDLNAIHEAEDALTNDALVEAYCEHLNKACGSDVDRGKPSFVAYFSTAAQRAEAFLRTLKLWVDE